MISLLYLQQHWRVLAMLVSKNKGKVFPVLKRYRGEWRYISTLYCPYHCMEVSNVSKYFMKFNLEHIVAATFSKIENEIYKV